MIRIVDILKKAEGEENKGEPAPEAAAPEEPPAEEKKPPVSIAAMMKKETAARAGKEEIRLLLQKIILLVKVALTRDSVDQAMDDGRMFVSHMGKIVDQHMLGNRDAFASVNHLVEADGIYSHALRVAISAIKLGIDVGYDREPLLGLSLAAFVYDLGLASLSGKLGSGGFKTVISRLAKIEDREYKDIIKLAEIYEATAGSR